MVETVVILINYRGLVLGEFYPFYVSTLTKMSRFST